MTKTNDENIGKSRYGGLRLVGTLGLVAVAGIAIVVGVSAQNKTATPITDQEKQRSLAPTTKPADAFRPAPKIDPKTGQVRPLTPQEAKEMAEGLKQIFNGSKEDLKEVRNDDGSVSVDLNGQFDNVSIARKRADGTIEHNCVDEIESAAEFLGVDKSLVKRDTDSRKDKK